MECTFLNLNSIQLVPTKIIFFILLLNGFPITGNPQLSSWNAYGSGVPAMAPYIEPVLFNSTVFVGQTAYLPCVVKHLGDKTVSWMRRRDLHILSSGTEIYTGDPRVSLQRAGKLGNSWTLKILTAKKRDEGAYECQVNTEPKMTVTLFLVVLGSMGDEDSGAARDGRFGTRDTSPLPQLDYRLQHKPRGNEAKLIGPSLLQVREEETANFTCIISHGGGPPPNVTWLLNDVPVQRSSAVRGGINIETDKSLFSTVSTLVIFRVHKRDEGKYTCAGEKVHPASVLLRVLEYAYHHDNPQEELSHHLSSDAVGVSNQRIRISVLHCFLLNYVLVLLLHGPLI